MISRAMALTVPVRAALVAVASTAVGVTFAGLGDRSLEPCREPPGFLPIGSFCQMFRPREPLLLQGRRASLQEAVDLARHPLFLPARLPRALANERPQVWVADRQVGVRYRSGSRSGLVVHYGLWPTGRDPAAFYASFPREWGAGRPVSIDGWPGLVLSPDEAGPGQPPVSIVNVSFDRTEVRLYGRVPVQELIGIAESLQRVRSR
jgi:hypothetical protein